MKIIKNNVILEREGQELKIFLDSGWVEYKEEKKEVKKKTK